MKKALMETIRLTALSMLIAVICTSLASSLGVTASTGGNGNCASTGVQFGSNINDYANEHIRLNPTSQDLSNAYSGTGSLPNGYISKSDSKGNSAYAYRSVSGKSGVTSWNYDWNTYTPYSSTAGYGVGTWLRLNVNKAYGFSGGSYAKNNEGDYARSYVQGSSSSLTASYLSNMYTYSFAYSNEVFSRLSADYGSATNYIYFNTYSNNAEGESSVHLINAYGTSSNSGRIYYPYIDSTARKTYAGVYGQTSGAYGQSALFRTHVENKAKMIGHDGTYYSGGGDFGFKTTNNAQLKGSVLGRSYTSSLSLSPSTNAPSYRTALLLDPYYSEVVKKYGFKDWGSDAFNSLANKGIAVTYYRDSAVTHSLVGTMDDYYISTIESHMNNNAIEITDAAESDRIVTGSELASMFTKNPQGLILFAGCSPFYPKASSPIANAVKSKEWLSGGYTYSVDIAGSNLYMSKFFKYLTSGKSAKTASQAATQDVLYDLGVPVIPLWTPTNHDFVLL
jgi:hypothetical protein